LPAVKNEIKAWVEILLRLDTAEPLDVPSAVNLMAGNMAGYFPSQASCPLHEFNPYVTGAEPGCSISDLMEEMVPWLMRPRGVLAERPFNLGDIIHLCFVTHSNGVGKLTSLNVLLLPSQNNLVGFNTTRMKILPDVVFLSFVTPTHVSYLNKV
jgi:hypothetical protein